MNEVSQAEKEDILQKCHDFLDNWDTLTVQDVEINRLISGIANKTYRVTIKDAKCLNNNDVEHKDVIVRIYNSGVFKEDNKIKFNGEAAEVIVMQILSEKGLAAQLLGVFPGGRIEEYIPSRVATVDDLKSVELSKAVIRKIANYHTQSMPVPKQPQLLDKIIKVYESTNVTGDVPDMYANETEECLTIIKFPVKEELKWLKQILPIIGHKIVFSHNDLNPNNILLKDNMKNVDEKVFLIDYEMSMYFYRAYDLVNFLRMKQARLQMVNNKISFSLDEEDTSANEEILQEYLNESRKLNENDFDPKIDNVDTLRMEVAFFQIFFDICIIAFMTNAMYEAGIPFPLNLAARIATEFKAKKQSVIDKYGDPLTWK